MIIAVIFLYIDLSWEDFIVFLFCFFHHFKSSASLKKTGKEGEKPEDEEDDDADLVCDSVL